MKRTATTLVVRTKLAVLGLSAGALIAISAPLPAFAAETFPIPTTALGQRIAKSSKDLQAVYAAREYRPLWLTPTGEPSPAVGQLLEYIDTAQFDAIDGKPLKALRTKGVRRVLADARDGDTGDVARAELAVSALFAQYVRAVRGAHRADMIYESPALASVVPTPRAALAAAARAPSLERYVEQMGWMHPFYAPLRKAMTAPGYSVDQHRLIWENLDRVRALPGTPAERYVLVDAASARLWMYENGAPVDSMKVVVGKPETPTPVMAGFLRHAIVNPYWDVPIDLAQRNIAANVVKSGIGYLKKNGYEVLSDFTADAVPIDARKVNWKAAAKGTTPIRVRQKPSGANFMGKVKYEFPNPQGIYLHDTPERQFFKEEARQISNGCVRLEDADRFGRWLLGKPLPKAAGGPEQRIELSTLVPVYITYLTALPTERGIAFRNDVYRLDAKPQLALAQ